MIHKIRRQEGRRNAVIYGISTDGDEFRFWRIDNDGVVRYYYFQRRWL
jgi:hypothetical protein